MKHIAYIHGLNSSSTSFSYIISKLPEHKAYRIDYNSHQSLETSIAEVISKLPRDQKVTLVAHSLGGIIATLVAAQMPNMVERLILISTPFKGSHAASTLRWIPGCSRVLHDIIPTAPHITRCRELALDIPTLNIISTGGSLQTSPVPNDGVVTISSQRGLCFGERVEINATHFEVLMSDRTVNTIRDFIFSEENVEPIYE